MPTETAIVRQVSPEEQELASKRRELEGLLAELVERELSLTDLKAELASFEGQYLREVGVLYAELDEWTAKIAELMAKADGIREAQTATAEARKQADETYAAAHGDASKVVNSDASPELKRLRKEVMRSIHPDYAEGEADRVLRERLSKEASAAYLRADADALRKILEEYKSSPESVKGMGVADELERVVRQIKQILRRIAEIEAEFSTLFVSDFAQLMAKVQSASIHGRDVLAEMAADVRVRISVRRDQFEAQLSKANQP